MMPFAGRIASFWDRLRTSYWFLPSALALAAAVLAVFTLRIDATLAEQLVAAQPWLATTGADGARSLLSTIAGSMITVAGVVFSITIVALTLASSQFGPRLLRNFLSDRGNQIVLGTFIAVFLYCLIVLRMVSEAGAASFTPHVSVLTALVLAAVSLGVLIYFIHHVSHSLQSTHVVDGIARQIEANLDVLFPEGLGDGESDEAPARSAAFDGVALRPVVSERQGYVRAIEDGALMTLAREKDLRIRIQRCPGEMVFTGTRLAEVDAQGEDADGVCREIAGLFVLGEQRTPVQDLFLPFEELAEVAVRALSPGVNDPKTATECIDGITRGLVLLVRRAFPSAERRDEEDVVRVIAPAPRFEDFVAASLDPIRRHARGEPAVLIALVRALGAVADQAPGEARRTSLRALAHEILESAEKEIPSARDRAAVRTAHARAFEHLGA